MISNGGCAKMRSVYKTVNSCYNKMSNPVPKTQKTRLFGKAGKKGAFLWKTKTALTSKNSTVR